MGAVTDDNYLEIGLSGKSDGYVRAAKRSKVEGNPILLFSPYESTQVRSRWVSQVLSIFCPWRSAWVTQAPKKISVSLFFQITQSIHIASFGMLMLTNVKLVSNAPWSGDREPQKGISSISNTRIPTFFKLHLHQTEFSTFLKFGTRHPTITKFGTPMQAFRCNMTQADAYHHGASSLKAHIGRAVKFIGSDTSCIWYIIRMYTRFVPGGKLIVRQSKTYGYSCMWCKPKRGDCLIRKSAAYACMGNKPSQSLCPCRLLEFLRWNHCTVIGTRDFMHSGIEICNSRPSEPWEWSSWKTWSTSLCFDGGKMC